VSSTKGLGLLAIKAFLRVFALTFPPRTFFPHDSFLRYSLIDMYFPHSTFPEVTRCCFFPQYRTRNASSFFPPSVLLYINSPFLFFLQLDLSFKKVAPYRAFSNFPRRFLLRMGWGIPSLLFAGSFSLWHPDGYTRATVRPDLDSW